MRQPKNIHERQVDDIRAVITCPLSMGRLQVARMTREAFIIACKAEQRGDKLWRSARTISGAVCMYCERGDRVVAGEKFTPPAGITFYKLATLIKRRDND